MVTINPDGVSVKGCTIIYAPRGQAGEYAELATNPYRGCGHACKYCLAPDTLIQMADGTTRQLADVQIGDDLIGVSDRGAGNWRHSFAKSRVLNKVTTRKPAFRITLEDGHSVVCSGDHRWLTDRGWKYTTGSMAGPEQRPYLTTQSKIRLLSHAVETPQVTSSYKRGYLAGMIRGDATLKRYDYSGHFQRKGRSAAQANDVQHHFRLALADFDALDRSAEYLLAFGITTHRVAFSDAVGACVPLQAIRNHSKEAFSAITNLIEIHEGDSEWQRGWLAGIFDAEGGTSSGVLRIHNTDEQILSITDRAMARFGFATIRDAVSQTGCSSVRLLGGLSQTVRFFNLTAPAITRKFPAVGAATRGSSKVASIEPFGTTIDMLDITTSTENFIANGMVSHNCYVPNVTKQLRDEFNDGAVPRDNFMSKLRADAMKYRAAGLTGQVMLSFTTDPYHPGDTHLTRMVLHVLRDHGLAFCTLTKGGPRAYADIDLFRPSLDAFAVTLTSLDSDFSKKWEPGAALPKFRIAALEEFRKRGIFTWVSLEPVIDVEHSLAVVDRCHEFVDHWKIGRANYLAEITRTTDWRSYTERMLEKMLRLGASFYFKRDLQPFLPPGLHNPMRIEQHH